MSMNQVAREGSGQLASSADRAIRPSGALSGRGSAYTLRDDSGV